MPTYKNNGSAVATVSGERIEKGERLVTLNITNVLPTGVIEESALPSYNPVALSEIYSGNDGDTETITVPVEAGIRGVIHCTAGSCEVTFNDALNTPVLKLVAGISFEINVRAYQVKTILIEFTAATSAALVNLFAN